MNFITTVDQLAETLDSIEPEEHKEVMKSIKLSVQELEPFASWTKGGYTRNCLARTEKYELILLCWDVDAQTPIHGHGGENCWVYQVQGKVEEVRLVQSASGLIEINRLALSPGKLTYMNDGMGYHTITNNSGHRAMTLHIYASPIDACKVFNEKKDCFELKEMSYHTYKGNTAEPLAV